MCHLYALPFWCALCDCVPRSYTTQGTQSDLVAQQTKRARTLLERECLEVATSPGLLVHPQPRAHEHEFEANTMTNACTTCLPPVAGSVHTTGRP